ncbi:MAG: sterol desaturase family protein [Myxococcota bacterium]
MSGAPPLLVLALVLIAVHLGRYLLFAGGAWLAFWAWNNPFTARRRLQHVPFTRKDVTREVGFSVATAVLFGAFFALVFRGQGPVPLQHTGALRVLEFLGWLAFLIAVHDTYFYWSHRLLHHPRVFPLVHALHHQSKNPSPFAALAFHPLEALAQVVWAVPLALWLPIPSAPWFAFAFAAMLVNVLGHCGVEPYPASWQRHPVMKWLNFATFHNGHHLHVGGNYGLYFSVWDRWMGTLQAPHGEGKP